jgi:hypothetical protein
MAETATAAPTPRPQARLPPADRAGEGLAASDPQPIPAAAPIPPHQ